MTLRTVRVATVSACM